MMKQSDTIERTDLQNQILELEKKYFFKIKEIIESQSFIDDLLSIEKEIKANYFEYADTWDLKNKLKVPAERLVRHHIYSKWNKEIVGIYPSPVSSDLGIRVEDCVICIDVKTIDTKNNPGDLKSTSVERNQTSFDNKNYPVFGFKGNLKSIDNIFQKPLLTYVLKIVYRDDNKSFTLSRRKYPTVVFVCIPNGELSNLFDYYIIDNFKTYDYYKKTDGKMYAPFILRGFSKILSPYEKQQIDEEFIGKRGCSDVSNTPGIDNSVAYYDPKIGCIWWYTHINKKYGVFAVKRGGSVRFTNEFLKNRFDSSNKVWFGYDEWVL